MSDTKIKRPPISESDPAGCIGVPLLYPSKDWGFVPQKYRWAEPQHASYDGHLFGIDNGVIRHYEVRKVGDKLMCLGDEWILGFGGHEPPNIKGLYLFPQNDNEEFMDDELEGLDEKIPLLEKFEYAAKCRLESEKYKISVEQKEKRFKLLCAMAPEIYKESFVNGPTQAVKEAFKAADAILEAEGE